MSDIAEILQDADNAYAINDLARFRDYLDKARLIDRDSLEFKRRQARLAWREDDWNALEQLTASCLKERPLDREMVQLNARALSNSKQWSLAVTAWRRIIELRPGWIEGIFQLGRALLRAGLPYAAAREVRRLREISGVDALLAAIRLAIECGQMACAAELLLRLATEAPTRAMEELRAMEQKGDFRAVALAALGLGHSQDDDFYRKMSKAIARDLLQRAVASERRGGIVESYLDYSALAQIEPGDIVAVAGAKRTLQILYDTAKDHTAKNARVASQQTYLQILYCRPDDVRGLTALGHLMMANQEWTNAAQVWLALLESTPGDAKVLLQHARALDRIHDFGAALAAWRAVLAIEPLSTEAQTALAKLPSRIIRTGRQMVEERRYIDATKIFLTVPEGSSDHHDAARRLGQVLRNLRKEMRAAYKERRFEAVVSFGIAASLIEPDDQDIQRLLAKAAMRTRDYEIAAAAWTRLMSRSPEYRRVAMLQLAQCHMRLGRMDEGRTLLGEILREEPDNEDAKAMMVESASESTT